MEYVIKAGRIGFRHITPEDTTMVLGWRNSDAVRKYFIYKKTISIEEHLNWLKNNVDTGKVIQFIIYDVEKEIPFGSVYFRNIDFESKQAEYGVFIGGDEYIGKGYGQEVANLMIRYGFEEKGFDRIELRVFADNERALRCYKRVGFSQFRSEEITIEGVVREVVFMEVLRG